MTNDVGSLMFMSPGILNRQEYNEIIDLFPYSMVLIHIITSSLHNLSLVQIGLDKRPFIPETVSLFTSRIIQQYWSQHPSKPKTFEEIIISID